MVERFLFGDYQNWCISRWTEIPPKPGMGHTDEMMKSIWDEIQGHLDETGCARNNDVSGWDLSVYPKLMEGATEVPIRVMEPPKLIVNAMRNSTYCLYMTLWVASDGVLLVQVHPGVMKSGSFRTASLNSDMRCLKSYEVTLDCGGSEQDCFAISMGDDCVEDGTGEFEIRKAEYAKYGIRLTDCVELKKGEPFEFTSHMYRSPGVASLHTWPKTLYRLLMKPFDASEFMQFCYECRHNFELTDVIGFLLRIGWLPPDNLRITINQCALRVRTFDAGTFDWYRVCSAILWLFLFLGVVNVLVASGLSWGPQNFCREDPSCLRFMSTKKGEKKAEKKVEKEIKREVHRLLPASASSTGRQKEKVIHKPKDAAGGSVRNYATPHNALNSQIHKFMPSQVQAALMAWAHTVANPRTQNPHPVPIACAPGASASVPLMYQCTLYGVAKANSLGKLFIGANADAWYPLQTGSGGIDQIQPGNKFITQPGTFTEGQGAPVHYTTETYAGTSAPLPVCTGAQFPPTGASATSGVNGLNFAWFPGDFVPTIVGDTRYTCVSVELRARPVQAALYASGELVAFNYRRAMVQETIAPANTLGNMLAMQPSYLSRNRVACPNWPTSKWLTTVAVPNTGTCFGQWIPSGNTPGTYTVAAPSVFIFGDGLPDGAPVEFEATYNYAIYGARTYTTSGSSGADALQVDGSRATPVVANGFTLLQPTLNGGRPDARGVGAVVKAEQQDGRMPSVKDVIGGVKAGVNVIESVTGTDIGEEIASIIGDIAAFLI